MDRGGELAFKTLPFAYQGVSWCDHVDEPVWAHHWDQGSGKTWMGLNTAAYHYDAGRIQRLLVVAPNGVHRNWITDEAPVHLPDWTRPALFSYESSRASTKRAQREAELVTSHRDGLAVAAISYHGIMTTAGKRFATRFLSSSRSAMFLDEAHHIKSPNIPRTRFITRLGREAEIKRVFTGTPVDEGPFDIFAPIRALDEGFWRRQRPSLRNYTVFRSYFGRWSVGYAAGGREFPQLEGYRNLDRLRGMLSQISDRLLLSDVAPYLPEHRFTRRSFPLPASWRRAYDELESEFRTEVCGETVTAELSLTRSLRCHQIACGYVATDDGKDPVVDLPGKNPRLELLRALCDDMNHQAIIWAAWTRDIDKIMEILGDRAVRYDGSCSIDQREDAKRAMREGRAQFFVANPAAAGEGLTILVPTAVYYSLGYKARHRNQSLARNRRPGAEQFGRTLEVIDICAENTRDTAVIASLVKKKKVSAEILGDKS